MKVLIDDRWLGTSGIGRYADEILKRQPMHIYVRKLGSFWPIKSSLSPVHLSKEIRRQSDIDLFWTPGFMPPAFPNKPFVITIHDLIHKHYGNILHSIYYDNVIRPLARSAAMILTVSEYSRQEILEWMRLPPHRVVAVHSAASLSFSPHGAKWCLPEPYLLYVGNRRSHKNLRRLIEAYSISKISSQVLLAISGESSVEMESIISAYKMDQRVIFLGDISEPNLPAIYRGALGFVYVSLYEGFGLPPLEAMASGTPVLVGNRTSLPEVVGDAAVQVDPFDIEAIADGLLRLVGDSALREDLARRGLERARQFSWDRTAEQTWRVLDEAARE